jgi:hypothetical protein
MTATALVIHKEADPKILINRCTDYNPDKDPYYVGFVFGGWDWITPVRDCTVYKEYYKRELFDKTVKVKNFPFEELKDLINEIINEYGESVWCDDLVSSVPDETSIEDAFNSLNKELYCTLCFGKF